MSIETTNIAIEKAAKETQAASFAVANASKIVAQVNKKKSKLKFELFADKRGEYRWRLKASNGKIIADSGEGYKNKSDCQHGINLIISAIIGTKIIDLTKK